MKCVIIAGGKGTRLGLKDIPKPMVPISGKPLLEHQILLAKRYGIRDFMILSGHLAEVIVDYFGDGSRWGVHIEHLVEPCPLGTAGAVKLAQSHLNERFLVLYGDVVMDFDIQRFIEFDRQFPDSMGSLIVHPNDHPYDSDLVATGDDHLIAEFYAKPHEEGRYYQNLVNAAVYILSPKMLDHIPEGESLDFGRHIFPQLIQAGAELRAYQTPEYIKDMGTSHRLQEVMDAFESGKVAAMNLANKRPAVFLDRDGVINKNMDNSATVEQFDLLPGVGHAVRTLNQQGILTVLVTNQPGLAKGFFSEKELSALHDKMEFLLGKEGAFLDAIYYCPHHPDKGFSGEVEALKTACSCRKPEPGMLLKAATDLNIDLANSWMVGDSDSDVQAGHTAGCRTLLIASDPVHKNTANAMAADLLAAVSYILQEREAEE